jgi:hypothetical protein
VARSPRQEFRKSVQSEIKARAVDEHGVRRCECCGYLVQVDGEKIEGARKADVDHKRACWTQSADAVKERPPLTANDGWLICEVCHKAKTRREAFERMRTNGAGKDYAEHLEAMEAKMMGIELDPKRGKLQGRGFPKTSRKLKGRGFPTKEERQRVLHQQHTYSLATRAID